MNNKRNFKQNKAKKRVGCCGQNPIQGDCVFLGFLLTYRYDPVVDVSDLSLSYVISKMLNKYLLLLCSALNTQELPDKGCELNKLIVCLV
jgi:hypothetical protein